ncbi:MAG TPA: XkdF-like putative serine protease domain-containing protein [Edaphobacter sp.]|nr:XkdF-like putative serine protease domain-containing protein [Edaphobacter sp.]
MSRKVRMSLEVVRKSDELGIIWGYASVADIQDLQGDTVPQDELVGAVYQFMEDYYADQAAIGDNHEQAAQAVLVESTFHFLATRLRWYVGVKLLDEDLLKAARAGEISGFSIGGWAEDEEESGGDTAES